MRVSIFDSPDKVGEEELQRDLLLLPAWRRKQAAAYRHLIDQVQCAKAYILLHDCLAEEYGISEMPSFEYGEYGKPRLSFCHDARSLHATKPLHASSPICFNLSHCSKGVMCVVDDKPVGCDIEMIPEEVEADVVAACFSLAEQERIFAADKPQVEFMRLWTAKEALLKLEGIGLIDDLSGLLTSSLAEGVCISTTVCEQKGYVYSVASKAVSEIACETANQAANQAASEKDNINIKD